MKVSLFSKRFIWVILLCIPLLNVYAYQSWDGTSSPPANVLNEDLFIDGSVGDILLKNGQTTIQALSTSVNVSISNSPNIKGVPGSSPILFLQAANGNSINFFINGLNNDLNFLAPDSSSTPLLIIATTDGSSGSRINFNFGDGNNLKFLSNGTNTAGVQYYQWMQDPAFESPTTAFSRIANGTNLSTVVIDNLCVLSYLSPQAHNSVESPTNTGRFLFDPSNTQSGRFAIKIGENGALIVEGHATSGVTNPALITFADIQRNIPAGLKAHFEVTSASSGSLLVINSNNQSFGLLADPFGDQAILGSYTGLRLGYVLGGAGSLTVNSNTYFDYVGLYQTSHCPTSTFVPDFPNIDPQAFFKGRNPSAFFVDSINPNYLVTSTAEINISATAGVYLRSGVDALGNVNTNFADSNVFTINPFNQSPDQGAIVFDIEGPLKVQGAGITASKIEILSWQVSPIGGPLQPGGSETIFPLRTFAIDGYGKFVQYNKASMFVNNALLLYDVSLDHTDELHTIYQKNDASSQPTYVGGESWLIPSKYLSRPNIQFINAALNIYTNVAFTGLDLTIPNFSDTFLGTDNNNSQFVYYYSGRVVEDSTGRMMIMGTQVGSKACDDCTVVSQDAHIDIMQTNRGSTPGVVDTLFLNVGVNTNQIDNTITGSIANQFGIHTIFLGNNSNITVGNQLLEEADIPVQSVLTINGNYFSFETNGGVQGIPSLSGVTGKGGIFVDNNGTITMSPNVRTSFGTMVTKSGDGVIDLPKAQAFFESTVGITDWNYDLSVSTTIIPLSSLLSDYSFNWINIKKNYAGGFIPYELTSVNIAAAPAVTSANIFDIPTVLGEVDQLQIQGSRIGDQAHIKIDGGRVRELIFQRAGGYAAQAAVALIVLQNEGRVGLGSALRNVDSFEGPFMLGVNGVSLVVNGNGQVDLNENMLVNNVFPLLKGPDGSGSTLIINSEVPQELRIKSEGVLDLTQFVTGDTIKFTGYVKLILEPGAKVITGGATLLFADDTSMYIEPYEKSESIFDAIPHDFIHSNTLDPLTLTSAANAHNQFAPLSGTGSTTNTDPFRVRLIGTGTYLFANNSLCMIPQYGFVGVETYRADLGTETIDIPATDLTFELQDNATFVIGEATDHYTLGGSLQIGDTTDWSTTFSHATIFTLNVNSPGATFSVHSQAFVGFGVGIVDKRATTANNWLVDTLYGVGRINIAVTDGVFDHSRTFSGENELASLVAFGPTSYTWILETDPSVSTDRTNEAVIHGGGNIVLVNPSAPNISAYHPVVNNDSPLAIVDTLGTTSPVIQTGILASRLMMTIPDVIAYDAQTMFDTSRVKEITFPAIGRSVATAAYTNDKDPALRRSITAGFVNNLKIGRTIIYDIADSFGGLQEDRLVKAAQLGAVSVQLNDYTLAPGAVAFAQQLP